VVLDLVRAATVLLLPFVDAVWQVYALIFAINACSAGFTPLFQATIPDVLPDGALYTCALSLSRLAYDLQQLLAPVVANIGWGIRLYLATPRLRGLLEMFMAVAAATAIVIVNTVVYVRDVLGGGDTLVTVAYAASGGGSMRAERDADRGCGHGSWHDCWNSDPRACGAARHLVPDRGRIVACAEARRPAAPPLLACGGPTGALLRAGRAFACCWLVTYLVAGVVGNEIGLLLTFGLLGLLVVVSALRSGFGHLPIMSSLSTSTGRCSMNICTHMTSITSTSMRAGRTPNRTNHLHRHAAQGHRHRYVIDMHHQHWPA
jgi:hypothetical protein